MRATEAQVTAAQEALGDHGSFMRWSKGQDKTFCRCKGTGWMTWAEHAEHRAHAVADAVVAAGPDQATTAAEALREAAAELGEYPKWQQFITLDAGPLADAWWLRERADRIEAGQ